MFMCCVHWFVCCVWRCTAAAQRAMFTAHRSTMNQDNGLLHCLGLTFAAYYDLVSSCRRRLQTVTISSEENARAWLSKWVTDQGTKPGSGVFANLGIVVENGSFLVRCLSCFEADPEDEAAIVKGADICSPSFRTHIIRRHFTQGTNSKGSPHDKGQETLRMRNSMKTSLEVRVWRLAWLRVMMVLSKPLPSTCRV